MGLQVLGLVVNSSICLLPICLAEFVSVHGRVQLSTSCEQLLVHVAQLLCVRTEQIQHRAAGQGKVVEGLRMLPPKGQAAEQKDKALAIEL